MRTLPRFLIVIAALVIVLGGLFGWRIFQLKQMAAQFSQPQPPTPVAATRAQIVEWVPAIKSVGSLRAINGVEVANEVPGVVEQIMFESGARVEQGEVLLTLDAATDEAALRTLRAEERLAQTEFERVSELINRGAVSQAEFDTAQANLEAATARAREQEAQTAKKTIRAPFAGVLGLRHVDLGEYLPVGTPTVEINMLNPIYVEYTVGEKELSEVAVGYEAQVALTAIPGRLFSGTVSAINTSVSPNTRTITVRATIPNPDRLLQPGMFATVRTLQPQARELVVVPRTAISFNTYGDFVFVLTENEEGQLVTERRSVVTGEVRDGLIEIENGLEAGEQVVKTGLLRLRAGQPIQIQTEQEQPPATSTATEEAAS